MTQPDGEGSGTDGSRYSSQLDYLRDAWGARVGVGPAGWEETGVDYLYRAGYVLVREPYLEPVLRALYGGDRPDDSPDQPDEERLVRPVVAGVSLVRAPGETLAALAVIERAVGRGAAAPDHVLSICPTGYCPATEPRPVPPKAPPDPGPSMDRTGGEGVRVLVVDTGLDPVAPATHAWLAGVSGERDDLVDPNTHELRRYAGHGTFVAGVLRCTARRAEVHVVAVLGSPQAGAAFESDLVVALDKALDDAPDIISMSAGTLTYDATGLLSFVVFERTRLRHRKGVVLVVAAGNNDGRKPFYPAAFDWTVSVGGLARDWRHRATYSDYGGWVDVYAPSEDLVNAFPTGIYTCQEPPHKNQQRSFDGMARWSGTSFAAPIVSGLVAVRMSHTGENGKDAARALIAQARSNHFPGVGAVLLPF